ncbi:MAG: type II toxin-antitoxin system HicA family toxin [Candidatus Gracilibacteria bacterium]|nr:type II toxin-antitoxin system HicA family toxin [Candidatus Gracilibacteria bacterium]
MVRFSGSHHQFIYEDKTITILVHNGRDIGRGLLRTILKQGGISHEEFLDILGVNN